MDAGAQPTAAWLSSDSRHEAGAERDEATQEGEQAMQRRHIAATFLHAVSRSCPPLFIWR